VSKRSENFSVYMKKQGQFQFSFAGPRWKVPEGKQFEVVDKEGAIFIEAAPTLDDGERCDWGNKIIMALGSADLGQILSGLKVDNKVHLVHDHNGKTSTFKIEPGNKGSFKLSIGQKEGANNKFVSVYAKTHQIMSFVQLVEFAVPRVLGWDQV